MKNVYICVKCVCGVSMRALQNKSSIVQEHFILLRKQKKTHYM